MNVTGDFEDFLKYNSQMSSSAQMIDLYCLISLSKRFHLAISCVTTQYLCTQSPDTKMERIYEENLNHTPLISLDLPVFSKSRFASEQNQNYLT